MAPCRFGRLPLVYPRLPRASAAPSPPVCSPLFVKCQQHPWMTLLYVMYGNQEGDVNDDQCCCLVKTLLTMMTAVPRS